MVSKILGALCSLFVMLSVTSPAAAHPGSLDDNGGHHDRVNGTYHYHDGINNSGESDAPIDEGDYQPEEENIWTSVLEIFLTLITLFFGPAMVILPFLAILFVIYMFKFIVKKGFPWLISKLYLIPFIAIAVALIGAIIKLING